MDKTIARAHRRLLAVSSRRRSESCPRHCSTIVHAKKRKGMRPSLVVVKFGKAVFGSSAQNRGAIELIHPSVGMLDMERCSEELSR